TASVGQTLTPSNQLNGSRSRPPTTEQNQTVRTERGTNQRRNNGMFVNSAGASVHGMPVRNARGERTAPMTRRAHPDAPPTTNRRGGSMLASADGSKGSTTPVAMSVAA